MRVGSLASRHGAVARGSSPTVKEGFTAANTHPSAEQSSEPSLTVELLPRRALRMASEIASDRRLSRLMCGRAGYAVGLLHWGARSPTVPRNPDLLWGLRPSLIGGVVPFQTSVSASAPLGSLRQKIDLRYYSSDDKSDCRKAKITIKTDPLRRCEGARGC